MSCDADLRSRNRLAAVSRPTDFYFQSWRRRKIYDVHRDKKQRQDVVSKEVEKAQRTARALQKAASEQKIAKVWQRFKYRLVYFHCRRSKLHKLIMMLATKVIDRQPGW